MPDSPNWIPKALPNAVLAAVQVKAFFPPGSCASFFRELFSRTKIFRKNEELQVNTKTRGWVRLFPWQESALVPDLPSNDCRVTTAE